MKTREDKKQDHWKNSVAGIAANLASQILYPLENVKLRFQGKSFSSLDSF